jgi:hypothetical protein
LIYNPPFDTEFNNQNELSKAEKKLIKSLKDK